MSESIITTRAPVAALGAALGKNARKTRRAHRIYRAAIERAQVRAATGDETSDGASADALGRMWRERRERQFAILRQIARTPAESWPEIDAKAQAIVTARVGLADNHPSPAILLTVADSLAADMRRLIETGAPAGVTPSVDAPIVRPLPSRTPYPS